MGADSRHHPRVWEDARYSGPTSGFKHEGRTPKKAPGRGGPTPGGAPAWLCQQDDTHELAPSAAPDCPGGDRKGAWKAGENVSPLQHCCRQLCAGHVPATSLVSAQLHGISKAGDPRTRKAQPGGAQSWSEMGFKPRLQGLAFRRHSNGSKLG